jgi:hypothetical protein
MFAHIREVDKLNAVTLRFPAVPYKTVDEMPLPREEVLEIIHERKQESAEYRKISAYIVKPDASLACGHHPERKTKMFSIKIDTKLTENLFHPKSNSKHNVTTYMYYTW